MGNVVRETLVFLVITVDRRCCGRLAVSRPALRWSARGQRLGVRVCRALSVAGCCSAVLVLSPLSVCPFRLRLPLRFILSFSLRAPFVSALVPASVAR